MKIFVGVAPVVSGSTTLRVIKAAATFKAVADAVRGTPFAGDCQILEAELELDRGAQANISADYEFELIEETVLNRLTGGGSLDVNAEPVKGLVRDIASDAYRDVSRYGVEEDYAVDEALKAHAENIAKVLVVARLKSMGIDPDAEAAKPIINDMTASIQDDVARGYAPSEALNDAFEDYAEDISALGGA